MNVLLVYPSYPDTFWSFKTVLKYISKKAAFPPLGLLTVAAMLPREWNLRLVDVNVRELTDQDLDWADLVMVSAMIVQKDSAHAIIERCSELGRKVVAGGPLFNTRWESFPQVDHFVLDEAEVTLPLFLEDMARGAGKRIYRSNRRPDINTTPVPAWHLIDMEDYATMCVQYSRGCPFNCEFCDIIIMNGRVPRTKKSERLLAELESLYRAGWRRGVFIVDDNFIGNTNKVKAMLPHLIAWQQARGHPFQFLTEASTNLADDEELMWLMSAANFHKVFLGIETPEVESLRECGKLQNASRDLVEAVRVIQRHGMQVMGGFIVGFDSDTESTFEAQVRFIQQVGIVTAMVGVLNALPQTKLWHRMRAENRLLQEVPGGENTAAEINFIPRMGRDRLLQGYRSIIASIYSRRMYYKRINVFLSDYVPTVRGRFTRRDLRPLFLSMLRIGIFSLSSVFYWKLLIKTLFTKARALPEVIEMTIVGEHYRRMRKRVLAAGRDRLEAGVVERQ